MKKTNICILFGGVSSEHEVSLKSAGSVLAGLSDTKYNIIKVGITRCGEWFVASEATPLQIKNDEWQSTPLRPCTFSVNRKQPGIVCTDNGELFPIDVVFPVLHGENGEDGRVQGMCELAGVPCVGPGTAASAISMDKALTKLVAATTGVCQADYVVVTNRNFDSAIKMVEEKFTYPVFVKPASTGSSVGTSKAKNREELVSGASAALEFGGKVLVEEFVDAREIETAVLGNDDPEVSVCGEVVPSREFYSYESKYTDNTSVIKIPAPLPEETACKIREYAKKIYLALGCRGMSRVDFFVTKAEGKIVFNEINTIPGFTDISMYAKLFKACGVSFETLLDRIIAYAMEE